jgi:hypothetical protein
MQVRSAGKARVARVRDVFAALDHVARPHPYRAAIQMRILGERAVLVQDAHQVGRRAIARRIGPALKILARHFEHDPAARRMDIRADRHRDIDGIATIGGRMSHRRGKSL